MNSAIFFFFKHMKHATECSVDNIEESRICHPSSLIFFLPYSVFAIEDKTRHAWNINFIAIKMLPNNKRYLILQNAVNCKLQIHYSQRRCGTYSVFCLSLLRSPVSITCIARIQRTTKQMKQAYKIFQNSKNFCFDFRAFPHEHTELSTVV